MSIQNTMYYQKIDHLSQVIQSNYINHINEIYMVGRYSHNNPQVKRYLAHALDLLQQYRACRNKIRKYYKTPNIIMWPWTSKPNSESIEHLEGLITEIDQRLFDTIQICRKKIYNAETKLPRSHSW